MPPSPRSAPRRRRGRPGPGSGRRPHGRVDRSRPHRTGGRRVVSSATSPVARSRAIGIPGARRLANTMVSRSGARATISRAMNWTSGASSTRWKSSKIRTAPYGAIVRSSRMKTSTTVSRVGPLEARVGEHRRRVRRERRIDFAARRDQVVEHGDPVPVVFVEAVPQRPQPGPAREVGEERGLAVARRRPAAGRPAGGSSRRASRGVDGAPGSPRATAEAGPSRTGSGSRSRRRGGLR